MATKKKLKKRIHSLQDECERLEDARQILLKRNAELCIAMGYYADEDHYTKYASGTDTPCVMRDAGEVARQALDFDEQLELEE